MSTTLLSTTATIGSDGGPSTGVSGATDTSTTATARITATIAPTTHGKEGASSADLQIETASSSAGPYVAIGDPIQVRIGAAGYTVRATRAGLDASTRVRWIANGPAAASIVLTVTADLL